MGSRILFIAGDPSGDHQAARLATELLRRDPSRRLYGLGGAELRAAGVRIDDELVALSAIGLWDVLFSFLPAQAMFRRLRAQVTADPPDAAVLVDCGAFNLPAAKLLKSLGVPVLGYFPPGSWSGSKQRATDVAAVYDAVATPFPQPLPAYAELGLRAELVGHPLVEELAPLAASRSDAVPEPPVLGLLPGSRKSEIRYILPALLDTAVRLQQQFPTLDVLVSCAPSAPRALFEQLVRQSGLAVRIVEGTREVLRDSTAVLVKSGTVTLEASLLSVPMVVVYRTGPIAYLVAGVYYWPRPRFWAMPNILAQDYVVPQLFQFRCTPSRLAAAVAPLLVDTAERRTTIKRLAAATADLRSGHAVTQTADLLEELLSRGSPTPA